MLKRGWLVLLVIAGVGSLLGLMVAAGVVCLIPKEYECRRDAKDMEAGRLQHGLRRDAAATMYLTYC